MQQPGQSVSQSASSCIMIKVIASLCVCPARGPHSAASCRCAMEAQFASQAGPAHAGGMILTSGYAVLGRVLYRNLESMWTKLEPVCQDLLLDAGHRQRAPSFQDFLWAYSIFWYTAAPAALSLLCLIRTWLHGMKTLWVLIATMLKQPCRRMCCWSGVQVESAVSASASWREW